MARGRRGPCEELRRGRVCIAKLEALTAGAVVSGLVPTGLATVVGAKWYGSDALELTYKLADGSVRAEILYRDREPTLEIAEAGRPWSFDGDGAMFRLVAEAKRIHLAYLFDPFLAVTTASVEALPHQITAVYEQMLPRHPLRFLLADDPGAGKTIMTGLFIRELLVRGALKRCLIIVPGSLVDQWQVELDEKFHLPFDILTADRINSSRGNPFDESDLLIARLDKFARDEDLQRKLEQAQEWDLVIFDEAHKLSATLAGDEVKKTKRRLLAEHVRRFTRNLLLLTATPHNGKPDDFQLFMGLLDPDRFEGHRRTGKAATTHQPKAPDPSDLMRRMIKEDLVRFDGTPLFPERRPYVVAYDLSPAESALYEQVTEYVRNEMDRAKRLEQEGEKKKGLVVGFALTVLQRRLASSPAAIHESLKRRKAKLEAKLREAELLKSGKDARIANPELDAISLADIEDELEDDEEATAEETEQLEDQVVDVATAAHTIEELRLEIESVTRLEALAAKVRASGTDTKWIELSGILHDRPEMFEASGSRRKIVIFTEHRDTLNYLTERLRTFIGKPEAVVTIQGGMNRETRKATEHAFKNDPAVSILVATDAAGEGINLQRAHLMVNYDLPWNPNRLEQRFGRIHRIGQNDVCHLWNLVAAQTREGEVYERLLTKLEAEAKDLGGRVFDVLGRLTFGGEKSLRDLLIEAIRATDTPEVRARMSEVVDRALDRTALEALLAERALGADALDTSKVQSIREEMEKASARRLQPHFIGSFFLEGFARLGGKAREREPGRYQLTHVPGAIRQRARDLGLHPSLVPEYERVTFDKAMINPFGQTLAEFVCPGHPLLDATIDLLMERHRDLLRQGAVLVDATDLGTDPRVLVMLDHTITDARTLSDGRPQVASRRMAFVELRPDGSSVPAGPAPYLDYEPATDEEIAAVRSAITASWLTDGLEDRAVAYAIGDLAREHLGEVRTRTEERVAKTVSAVKARLTHEIAYWDRRADEAAAKEQAGKSPGELNSTRWRQRANELSERLERRLAELELERRVTSLAPVIVGGALVIPAGMLAAVGVRPPAERSADPAARRRVEQLAMDAVMAAERAMRHEPTDVSRDNLGYDILSRTPNGLRFVEVKGRAEGATTITVTRNEIQTCLNEPDKYWLAVASVHDDAAGRPSYLVAPFRDRIPFAATSVNFSLTDLFRGPRGDAP